MWAMKVRWIGYCLIGLLCITQKQCGFEGRRSSKFDPGNLQTLLDCMVRDLQIGRDLLGGFVLQP
jgi:hypothetical protein